jgi:hypothetical protein
MGATEGEGQTTLNFNFLEVVIILGETVLRGPDHSTFIDGQGHNNFGRDKGKRARPLNIYFFEVVIILGKTEVRRPDHSIFIFMRS